MNLPDFSDNIQSPTSPGKKIALSKLVHVLKERLNETEISRRINVTVKVLRRRTFRKQKIKEFSLGIIFLLSLCLAGTESTDFRIFIGTKLIAIFLFTMAYFQWKSLSKRKETVTVKEGCFVDPSNKSGAGVTRFLEKRKILTRNVEIKLSVKKDNVALNQHLGFQKGK